MTIIAKHKHHYPSFNGIEGDRQRPVCLLTVLCLGGRGDDVAAYQGIIPDASMHGQDVQDALAEEVRRGGNKLREADAAKLFDFKHEGKPLTYRR